MWGSIKYNLTHLTDFSGRDARQTFWYFVLFLYLVNFAVSMAVMIPVMMQMFAQIFAAAQTAQPQNAELMVEQMMPGMMADMMGSIAWLSVTAGVFYILLLGAAFVRRLQDSNISGWWALLPATIYAVSLALIPAQIGAMTTAMIDMQTTTTPLATMQVMQAQGALGMLLGWTPVLIVIILGVRKSTEGPNPYGDAPVRF